MSQGAAPKATAQGTLRKTPFAHLLLYVHNRRLSGTLAVWPEVAEQGKSKAQDRVLFSGGEPVALKPVDPTVTDVMEGLMGLFQRTAAPYAFYEGQNWLGKEGVLEQHIHPYAVLARGVHDHARDDIVDAVLSKLGDRPLRMRPGVPLERLGLESKERAFVDTLRAAPAGVDDLVSSAELPANHARRLLYLLTLIKGVEAARSNMANTFHSVPPPSMPSTPPGARSGTGRHSVAPAGGARGSVPPAARRGGSMRPSAPPMLSSAPPPAVRDEPAPPPPAGLEEQDRQRWVELSELYNQLDDKNHYELLGITQRANGQEISNAYLQLVKKYHPDRLPQALAPLRRCAELLFERATEANETLTDDQQRDDYIRAVQAGGGTKASERLASAIVESAMLFQKAEVLTRRREYAQAMQMLQSAMNLNADEADYQALYAFLLHVLNPSEEAPFDDMLRALDKALTLNDRSERGHYYKGVVLKRMKRDKEALQHFRHAAELNPQNVEAAREVRLATMRRNSQPPSPGAGLLSKLFGSKEK